MLRACLVHGRFLISRGGYLLSLLLWRWRIWPCLWRRIVRRRLPISSRRRQRHRLWGCGSGGCRRDKLLVRRLTASDYNSSLTAAEIRAAGTEETRNDGSNNDDEDHRANNNTSNSAIRQNIVRTISAAFVKAITAFPRFTV